MARKRYAFWIDEGHLRALAEVRDRDGVLPSEQIRRALDTWFKERGIGVKAGRKRVTARKRP